MRDVQLSTLRHYVDRLALCSDHRDKATGRCIVCQAEERTKRELREALSTAGSPVPQPSEVLSLSIQNDPLAIGALLDDSTRTKEFYAGVVYEIQKLIGHSAFEAPTTELPKLVAERLAGSPVPSSELEGLLGMGTPWPVHDVLTKLADAADHLLKDHNCDRKGWEGVSAARDAAREAATRILAWGKADPSSPAGTQQVEVAERIARQAHAGQREESTGDDYIKHVERVVALVSADPDLRASERDDATAVAWLHDVIEDSDWTAERLLDAGLPHRVVTAVVELTRVPPYDYAQYIDQIRDSGKHLAIRVKLADLRDHLRPNCPERLRPRYELALTTLASSPAGTVEHDLLADLKELERLYNTDGIAQQHALQIEKIFDRWLHGGEWP